MASEQTSDNARASRNIVALLIVIRRPQRARTPAQRHGVSLLALRMYHMLGKNPRDTRECCTSSIGDALPTVGSWLADPVIERLRPRPGSLSHHDPADHPCGFVRYAVVVVDSRNRQRDVEGCAGLDEIARVP